MAPTEDTPRSGFLPLWLSVRLEESIGISQVLQAAAYPYLQDLFRSLSRGRVGVLFGQSNNEVKDQAFVKFYQEVGHDFANYESTTAVPSLVSSARGTVLDLGPGTGNQLDRFDASKVDHVYGVEPNTAFTERFVKRLQECKLGQDGKYTLVPCGIENHEVLHRFGIAEESVDCIVSMQVMCSLPNLDEQVRRMHRLLKPGGELIFWEHCRNPNLVTRATQWLWCLIWPSFIRGCRLDRVTRDALVNSVDWETIDIHTEAEPHSLMPRIWGRLVKTRG